MIDREGNERRKFTGSLRTQLIVATIGGLTLMLGLFGLFVRYEVTSTLMNSVDRELQERVVQMLRHPPPPPRPMDDNNQGPPGQFPGADNSLFPGQDNGQQQGPHDNQPPQDNGQPSGNDDGSDNRPPIRQPHYPGQPPADSPMDYGGQPPQDQGDNSNQPPPGGDQQYSGQQPQDQGGYGNGQGGSPGEPQGPPGQQSQNGGQPSSPGQPGGARNLPGGVYRPRRFRLDGTTLDRSILTPAWDPAAIKTAALTNKQVFTIVKSGTTDLRVLTEAVKRPNRPEWFVQAPYPLGPTESAIGGVDRALLTLIPIALLLAGLGGAFVTKNVLTRVGQMVHSAGRIGAENLSERLPVVGRDEFAELAETFNALLSRVDTAFQEQAKIVEQQRRFTADASHELKTPLTVIRGTTSLALTASGVLDRQSTQDIDNAAAVMSDLVQDLIFLARADAGQLGRERIDLLLVEPLQAAIDRISAMSEAPIRLVAANEYLTVNASESELIRLFSNILLNAAHHTPADGRVIVSLSSTTTEAVVMINDNGSGIAAEHIDHLTERFYRVDSARSRDLGGSGLGLAICKGIVDAHGGTLIIESTVGKGTTVTITLPKASSQPA